MTATLLWFFYRNVENAEEVAAAVFQMTRSISQIEYKREQYSKEKDALPWFAKADGKGCVKVDKNGNGLLELWLQQICQFNNVGLEVSVAIPTNIRSSQVGLSRQKLTPSYLLTCLSICSFKNNTVVGLTAVDRLLSAY